MGVAHLHADAYVANLKAADAQVVGVYDHDSLRAQAWGQRYDVSPFREPGDLFNQGLDGVLVCAETALHADLVLGAAEAGIPVLCEKPLAVDRLSARSIVRACQEAQVTLMTAFPTRFHPSVQRSQQLVDAGTIGRVIALSGANQGVMPLHERAWFVDASLAGGGALMDHVVHLADLYCTILARAPIEVYAAANRVVHGHTVTVETGGLVILSFPGGVVASIDCSWDRPTAFPSWGEIKLTIVGERGVLDVRPTQRRLIQYGGSGGCGWIPLGVDTNQLMIDEFLSSIRDRRSPSVTGVHGLLATEIALAAAESAASGEPLAFDSPIPTQEFPRSQEL